MKILLLSEEGDGFGIAHQLSKEGNQVSIWVKNRRYKKGLVGFDGIEHVDSWRPHVAGVDLVICDMVGMGSFEPTLRRMGRPMLGCSQFADRIELDRSAGMQLLEESEIGLPPTWSFDSKEQAMELIGLFEPPGFVIKPSNNESTAKTTVARDRETFIWALMRLEDNKPLIIQKIVEGVEVSCEGWFNGRNWITPFNITFEEKRFLSGNLGPNTGCMGNVVYAVDGDWKIVQETVMKLTPILKEQGYRGPIDINSIINEDGVFALEITPRFGYDAIEALMEGLQMPTTDFLFETAAGVLSSIEPLSDWMIAVRASIPPYPHSAPEDEDKRPITGINDQNIKHIQFTDIQKDEDGFFSADGDGVLMKVTARGKDIKMARDRVYSTLRGIKVQDLQYRKDIGARVPGDAAKLKDLGYLNG